MQKRMNIRTVAAVPGRLAWHGLALLKPVYTRKPLGAAGLTVVILLLFTAIFAEVLSPYDPLYMTFTDRFEAPNAKHPLGTDNFGRDILSYIIHGSRISLFVGFFCVLLGTGTGAIWGVVSGYAGRRFDLFSQRFIDILLGFPALVFALALVAGLGSSLSNTIIAISITFVPRTTRVVRASAITVKEMTYVDAARVNGCSPLRIILFHVLPNCAAPYLIMATSLLGTAILTEASLSFLGVGVPPPHAAWGRMLSGIGRDFLVTAPWISVFPGVAISIVVLAFNLFGDALRDLWDPRLRGGK